MPTASTRSGTTFRPTDFHLFAGLQVPDPITFAVGEQWLARPNLYPRQATLLKIIFLRTDLLTDFDYAVIDEWEQTFRRTGNEGITPGILARMHYLRAQGYSHFREVLLVLGRRAGKGYISALAMAYVLWRFLAKGDPQGYYGIDRDKQLAAFVFAGKRDQAKANLWKDLVHVITGGPCFARYISKPMGESLSIYAPHDFIRRKRLADRGIATTTDLATFIIEPKEATLMAGRGPASFMLSFDEMAHQVTAGGASRSAEEVYTSAVPSLDQFKKDAFLIEPSSPWQMTGQYFENWEHSLETDENGAPVYPEMMMLQLPSWSMYYDWERAGDLRLLPEGFTGDLGEYTEAAQPEMPRLKGAIQEYDESMRRLEVANPDTFAVERRSHWQATIDAYLDPNKIEEMFGPWQGEYLQIHTDGILSRFYKGHADPSLANANFAIAIAHPETDEHGTVHCVFDYIGHFQPSDFSDNIIDYLEVEEHLWRLIKGFVPDEFSMDQWNSAALLQHLRKRVREQRFPKRVQVYEQTATAPENFKRFENFKIALNQGWVHAPPYELAELELRFLQLKNGNKIDKQDTGPVVTKDLADALVNVCWTILGEQVHAYTHGGLSGFPLGTDAQGGFDPYQQQRPEIADRLSQLGRQAPQRDASARAGGRNPARRPSGTRGGRRGR